ncbi:hypothetical protein T439DRAFT_353441 [Meredithblackwellia eburnea MCA 4105]
MHRSTRRSEPLGVAFVILASVTWVPAVQGLTRTFEDDSTLLSYTPSSAWTEDSSSHQATASGASLSFSFAGQQVIVLGRADSTVSIILDGSSASPSSASGEVFRASNLDPSTTHTLIITQVDPSGSPLVVDQVKLAYSSALGLKPSLVNGGDTVPTADAGVTSQTTDLAISTTRQAVVSSATMSIGASLSSALAPFATTSSTRTSALSVASVATGAPSAFQTVVRSNSVFSTSLASSPRTPSASASVAAVHASDVSRERERKGAIAGGVIGGLIFLAVLAYAALLLWRRWRKRKEEAYWDANSFGRNTPPSFQPIIIGGKPTDMGEAEWNEDARGTAVRGGQNGTRNGGWASRAGNGEGAPEATNGGPSSHGQVKGSVDSWVTRMKQQPSWSRLALTRTFYQIGTPPLHGPPLDPAPTDPLPALPSPAAIASMSEAGSHRAPISIKPRGVSPTPTAPRSMFNPAVSINSREQTSSHEQSSQSTISPQSSPSQTSSQYASPVINQTQQVVPQFVVTRPQSTSTASSFSPQPGPAALSPRQQPPSPRQKSNSSNERSVISSRTSSSRLAAHHMQKPVQISSPRISPRSSYHQPSSSLPYMRQNPYAQTHLRRRNGSTDSALIYSPRSQVSSQMSDASSLYSPPQQRWSQDLQRKKKSYASQDNYYYRSEEPKGLGVGGIETLEEEPRDLDRGDWLDEEYAPKFAPERVSVGREMPRAFGSGSSGDSRGLAFSEEATSEEDLSSVGDHRDYSYDRDYVVAERAW